MNADGAAYPSLNVFYSYKEGKSSSHTAHGEGVPERFKSSTVKENPANSTPFPPASCPAVTEVVTGTTCCGCSGVL